MMAARQCPEFSSVEMATHLQGRRTNSTSALHAMLARGKRFNRIYSVGGVDQARGFNPTHYTKPLNYGGEPYYCPNGWRRYSLDVGLTSEEFDAQYKDWPVAFHGTSSKAANDIIINGFLASNLQACFIKASDKAVFLTPSIKYAGHPRYAKVEKVDRLYVQVVLQVRVNKNMITKNPGTVEGTFPESDLIDSNFEDNNELEWVFLWNNVRKIRAFDGIVIYGIMARITDSNPRHLSENDWWEESRERLKWDSYESAANN